MIKHAEIGKLEYNQITDYIYIGTDMCCQEHFDKKLLALGIEVDISLEKEKLDTPIGVKFFLWLPVKDHASPTPDQFDLGVLVLERLVAMKKKIYVHCKNGHGRAPTLVAAYLISQGKNVDEAIDFISAKRPSIHIEDTQKISLKKFSNLIIKFLNRK